MPEGPMRSHLQAYERYFPSLGPGDIAEFGVFDGGSTREMARLAPERRVWAFDTYEGMPAKEFNPIWDHDEPGKFKPTEAVAALFDGFGNIIPMKGRFEETIPLVPSGVKFCFVYMDCDLYESHRQVFEWLPKHLTPGAVILIDDYRICKGCKKAVDEFCAAHGLQYIEHEEVIIWNA